MTRTKTNSTQISFAVLGSFDVAVDIFFCIQEMDMYNDLESKTFVFMFISVIEPTVFQFIF